MSINVVTRSSAAAHRSSSAPDLWTQFCGLEVDNRRRAPRVNRPLNIRYRLGGQVETSVAINISQSGARLVLRSPGGSSRPQGEPGKKELVLLEIEGKVDVLARIVWADRMPGGQCSIAGVTFEPMGPAQRAALQGVLQGEY